MGGKWCGVESVTEKNRDSLIEAKARRMATLGTDTEVQRAERKAEGVTHNSKVLNHLVFCKLKKSTLRYKKNNLFGIKMSSGNFVLYN